MSIYILDVQLPPENVDITSMNVCRYTENSAGTNLYVCIYFNFQLNLMTQSYEYMYVYILILNLNK